MNRFLLVALVIVAGIAGCGVPVNQPEKKAQSAPPPVPVAVGRVERADVSAIVTAIGWVEAYSTVTVRSQVDGELIGVHFREGDDVKPDQQLFTIDPRPYQAALHLAEANLKRDQALADDARREAERIEGLFSSNQGSPRERDMTRADADAKAAQVRARIAEIEQARLEVERCTIRSPISGRAGSLLAHRGNIVRERDTPLVVLNQVSPIYVTFSVPDKHLGEIQAAAEPLHIEVKDPVESGKLILGTLSFVDNEVDRTTGMIRLKATFDNTDHHLWPGQFVDVRMTTGRLADVVIAPSTAIQAGQDRAIVYVVSDDKTVEARPVELGIIQDGRTVVTSGLAGGEIVVTDGHLRLSPGARVQFKNDPAAASQPLTTAEVAAP
ncbi:MAG: efflux RND transporter periplasmic adaptor subunit [Phycisphaerales bacterium]|nr:efflux RND transporter periplasmic adaptor subunit [Phycisphaerales bacterium]